MSEVNGEAQASNMAGVYMHKESGAELTALNEQQADGMVHMGYVRVGDVPTREELHEAANTDATDSLKEAQEGKRPEGDSEQVERLKADLAAANERAEKAEAAKAGAEAEAKRVADEQKAHEAAQKKEAEANKPQGAVVGGTAAQEPKKTEQAKK